MVQSRRRERKETWGTTCHQPNPCIGTRLYQLSQCILSIRWDFGIAQNKEGYNGHKKWCSNLIDFMFFALREVFCYLCGRVCKFVSH